MWSPQGILRYISRFIQDEIETNKIAIENGSGDDDDLEDLKTSHVFLEFEAKTLEHNLAELDDLEQASTAGEVDNLNRYCEQSYRELNLGCSSGML